MLIIDTNLHPEAALDEQIAALADTGAAERCFALGFSFAQYYLPGEPRIPLLALVALRAGEGGPRIEVALLLHTETLHGEALALAARRSELKAFAHRWGSPWLCLDRPLQLAPVHIAKPWGREIWLTGVEARGQSCVIARGQKTPLPWLLALAPERLLAGMGRQPILLKILDPSPVPVFGDLYFEVHRRKREVYVVTHVDTHAWPGGLGGIRYGFNPQKRARYTSDQAFKSDYLAAAVAYEAVRREIDEQLDRKRQACGVGLWDPVEAGLLARWQNELAPELSARERRLREAMEAFTAVRPLARGDVVTVPPLTPHSLLHGVRVVEFQTPDYGRHILSFGQKVLTQNHWDTADVLDDIELETPAQHPAKSWVPAPGFRVEELVVFPDFVVLRVHLEAAQSVALSRLKRFFPKSCKGYALIVGLEGALSWSIQPAPMVRPNEAQLIPAACRSGSLVSEQNAVFLLASPKEAE